MPVGTPAKARPQDLAKCVRKIDYVARNWNGGVTIGGTAVDGNIKSLLTSLQETELSNDVVRSLFKDEKLQLLPSGSTTDVLGSCLQQLRTCTEHQVQKLVNEAVARTPEVSKCMQAERTFSHSGRYPFWKGPYLDLSMSRSHYEATGIPDLAMVLALLLLELKSHVTTDAARKYAAGKKVDDGSARDPTAVCWDVLEQSVDRLHAQMSASALFARGVVIAVSDASLFLVVGLREENVEPESDAKHEHTQSLSVTRLRWDMRTVDCLWQSIVAWVQKDPSQWFTRDAPYLSLALSKVGVDVSRTRVKLEHGSPSSAVYSICLPLRTCYGRARRCIQATATGKYDKTSESALAFKVVRDRSAEYSAEVRALRRINARLKEDKRRELYYVGDIGMCGMHLPQIEDTGMGINSTFSIDLFVFIYSRKPASVVQCRGPSSFCTDGQPCRHSSAAPRQTRATQAQCRRC